MLRVLCCVALLVPASLGVDSGFDKLWTSQNAEVENLRLTFEKPLPTYLKGSLIRNSPSRFEVGNRRVMHWFDGFSKLASWRFQNNSEVHFTTKFIQTSQYKESMRNGDIAPYLLFDVAEPDFNFMQKMTALTRGMDNVPVSVHRFGSGANATYHALNDIWPNYSFDPVSLETKEYHKPDVPGGMSVMQEIQTASTSHPLPEHGTDNWITFAGATDPLESSQEEIRLIRVTSANGRELIRRIPVPRLPYMHSFAMSRNYAVIMAAPMYVDGSQMVSSSPLQSFVWKPEDGLTLYVVHLKTNAMFTVKTDSVFPMHFINSYEEDDHIIIDYACYDDLTIFENFNIDTMTDRDLRNQVEMNGHLNRFVINAKTQTVEVLDFPETPGLETANKMDLTSIHPDLRYNKHCYIYGFVYKADGENFPSSMIAKKDVCNPGNDLSWGVENHYPAEPIFVPNPDSSQEDDGVVLTVVLDGEKGTSYLGVLDARTMQLINRSYLPFHMPLHLHGHFFNEI